MAKGGYVLAEASGGKPQVILIGTGSEVQLCLTARERLEAEGTPDPGGLDALPGVVPRAGRGVPGDGAAARGEGPGQRRGGHRDVLARPVGDCGEMVSLEHYGASAPYTVLFEQFGFTPDRVVAAAHASLARVGDDHRHHDRQLRGAWTA